jgi:hypothetical protein
MVSGQSREGQLCPHVLLEMAMVGGSLLKAGLHAAHLLIHCRRIFPVGIEQPRLLRTTSISSLKAMPSRPNLEEALTMTAALLLLSAGSASGLSLIGANRLVAI